MAIGLSTMSFAGNGDRVGSAGATEIINKPLGT